MSKEHKQEIKDIYSYKELKDLIDTGEHEVHCNRQGMFVVDGKIITIKEDL